MMIELTLMAAAEKWPAHKFKSVRGQILSKDQESARALMRKLKGGDAK